LLNFPLSIFREAVGTMREAVADDSQVRLPEVHLRLTAVINAYQSTLALLMPIHEYDIDLRDIAWRFGQWETTHEPMKEKLTELLFCSVQIRGNRMPTGKKVTKVGQRRARGRPPEVLTVEGDWQDAVRLALSRGKPPAKKAAKKKAGRKKRRPE
jgi:hypothetical protein